MTKHKSTIKIPKGTKCADGTTCERDIEVENVEIDIPEVNPSIQVQPTPQVNIPDASGQIQQYAQPPPPIPQPQATQPEEKTFSNDELAELMPSGVNYAVCKGNNCADSVIKNKKFVTKFKQCPKCGCNNVPNNGSMCPCCGKSEPEDDEEKEDYWQDSDIEIESDDQ